MRAAGVGAAGSWWLAAGRSTTGGSVDRALTSEWSNREGTTAKV